MSHSGALSRTGFFNHEETGILHVHHSGLETAGLPTIFRAGPYRFFFYSNEGTEAPHVHVEREGHVAKLWLTPVSIRRSGGLPSHELTKIESIVLMNRDDLLREWKAFFDVRF